MTILNVYLYSDNNNEVIITKINIMTTLKSQNGIEIKFNGRNTYIILSSMQFGTSDVIYGCVSTEKKANNLFNKVLKLSNL